MIVNISEQFVNHSLWFGNSAGLRIVKIYLRFLSEWLQPIYDNFTIKEESLRIVYELLRFIYDHFPNDYNQLTITLRWLYDKRRIHIRILYEFIAIKLNTHIHTTSFLFIGYGVNVRVTIDHSKHWKKYEQLSKHGAYFPNLHLDVAWGSSTMN